LIQRRALWCFVKQQFMDAARSGLEFVAAQAF